MTDYLAEKAGSSLGNPADPLVTIGQRPDLNKLLGWADRAGVTQPLRLLLAATQTHDRPRLAGSALAFIQNPVLTDLMCDWEQELPFISSLVGLSQSCAVAPFISERLPPLPVAHPLSRQMRDGELSQFSLLALIARPVPLKASAANRNWINAFRAWCFIHYLRAVTDNASVSPYRLSVIRSLRIAIDQSDSHWWALYCRLRGPTSSWRRLTSHLARAAQSLQTDVNSLARPIQRTTLRQLEKFCRGERPTSTAATSTAHYSFFTDHVQFDYIF